MRAGLSSCYVDDMIINGDDVDGISVLKNQLQRHFKMKDLGSFRYFLRIKVSFSSKGCLLSQYKYASNALQQAMLTDSQTDDAPLKLNVHYSPIDGVHLSDPTLYHVLFNSLILLLDNLILPM